MGNWNSDLNVLERLSSFFTFFILSTKYSIQTKACVAMRLMMGLAKEHDQENQVCIVFSVAPAFPKKPSSV
jgi:hypothetical protein